jgi:hypothetical protein
MRRSFRFPSRIWTSIGAKALTLGNTMYRVPADLDLSVIVGTDLNMMGLGRYDVQFHFDSKATINLQSRAELLHNGVEVAQWEEHRNWSKPSFQKLLGQTVLGFAIPHDRLIEIQFTDGLLLKLYDDFDQFESMQISFTDDNLPTVII